jgi:dTDP-4-dehydrorhamnose reductase
MDKIDAMWLVLGSQGMLGKDLISLLERRSERFKALGRMELDIRDEEAVTKTLAEIRPAIVINAAAATNVDGCEREIDWAYGVNAKGAHNVAKAAALTKAHLIHISTDYVFDGRKGTPYLEEDEINPLGVYGKSKAEGERLIREALPDNHCIVRTQWLYGLNGKNFVETILNLTKTQNELNIVNDQFGSPTFTPDLAGALITIAEKGVKGTIHATNSGVASWFQFALKILDLSGLTDIRVNPISTKALDRPAPRPLNSVLDNGKYIGLAGSPLRDWQEALAEYLLERRTRVEPR